MRIDKNTTIKLGDRNIVKIKIGDSVIWEKKMEPDYLYVENTYNGSNTISVKQTITGEPDSSLYAKTLRYSKDKTNWTTITLSSTAHTITLNKGEKVYFRGNEGVLNYYANDGAIQAVTNILGTQTHTIGGNINTLVNYITPNKLTLTQGVFAGLFQNNTTITSAENLTLPPSSDDSLPTFAYCLMFSGCSALITPPSEIPATKQGHASCGKMFLDCIQLKTPPALKSTILGNYCFTSIFKNCISLISSPELPASTLTNYCYTSAFDGCTSLVNPPELPAKTLAEGCYRELFYGCSKLNNITVYANDISANNCTSNWLSGVASTGTFNNMGSATYTINSASGIPTGWTEKKPNEPDYLYIENTYNGTNTIYFFTTQSGIHPSSDKYSNQVEYSTDKVNWTTLTFNPSTSQSVVINTGEKLYLRNDTGVFNYYNGSANTYNTNINVSRSNIIGGNINTLLDYKNPDTVPLSHSCFFGLFRDNIATTDVSGLKFGNKTLSTGCYREMFYNCPELTKAPKLSATELSDGCYKEMFYLCSKLNSITVYANDISATNCTNNWLLSVASSGTFHNLGSATYETDSVSGIPPGWTEVKS